MISYIRGPLAEKFEDSVVVEAGNVGYRIFVPISVLERLATRYGTHDNLIGIELLDSPIMARRTGLFQMSEGIPSHYLRNFYRDAYELVRMRLSDDKMVVFSASGDPRAWKRFMSGDKYVNVCMDVHLYHYRDEGAVDITSPRGLSSAIARNRTVLIISHRLSIVSGADKTIVLDKGELTDFAPHRELLTRQGIYKDFWSQQMERNLSK